MLVEVDLRNTGWAKVFSARPLVVTLSNGSDSVSAASTTLLSSIDSQATNSTTIAVELTAPQTAGDWSVELSAPDIHATTSTDARFAIHFVNADNGSQQWSASTARFATGTHITVE